MCWIDTKYRALVKHCGSFEELPALRESNYRSHGVAGKRLEETIPEDMRYEREIMPLMRVLLDAGDMLYIPCGYWHRAQAVKGKENAISLAVRVMSRSAVDLFD